MNLLKFCRYEKHRLQQADKPTLADQVEWIARDAGDGAGFDILSKNENGTDRYIEVKTTKLGESTPFYFTRNELRVSREKSQHYHLYRVFQFAKKRIRPSNPVWRIPLPTASFVLKLHNGQTREKRSS